MSLTNPFSAVTVSGYNASPPPDDGSQTVANQITWDKTKTKLADPVKTAVEGLSSAMVAGGAKTINTDADQNNQMAGSLGFTSSELTISGFSVTGARSHHTISATGSTGVLALLTATNFSEGAIVLLRAAAGKTIYISSTATAAGAFVHPCLLDENSPLPFVYVSSYWRLMQSGWVKIDQQDASSSSSLEAKRGIGSAYRKYRIELTRIKPSTATGVALQMQVSENTGASYATATGNYHYNGGILVAPGTGGWSSISSATGANSIILSETNLGTASEAHLDGTIEFENPSATIPHGFKAETRYVNNGDTLSAPYIVGRYVGSQAAIDALRVLLSGGTITSGRMSVYALKE